MDNLKLIELSIMYLKELQHGRVKPDSKGTAGVIWESLDNVDDIGEIKKIINKLLKDECDRNSK